MSFLSFLYVSKQAIIFTLDISDQNTRRNL